MGFWLQLKHEVAWRGRNWQSVYRQLEDYKEIGKTLRNIKFENQTGHHRSVDRTADVHRCAVCIWLYYGVRSPGYLFTADILVGLFI